MKKRTISLISALVSLMASQDCHAQPNVTLDFEQRHPSAFAGSIRVCGLRSESEYIFSINGYVGKPGNEVLIEQCEEWGPTQEGYCDFPGELTDASGCIDKKFELPLKPSNYEVQFLIKDPDNGWKVIYNKHRLRFVVGH